MVRSSVLALVASVSLGTFGLASDAFARGGGGHFGGGGRDFGGGMREFHPEARPEMREERRPEEHRSEERRPAEHHEEADRNRDDAHRARDEAGEHRDENHDLNRNDLARHDDVNNLHNVNNLANGHWDHNQFWNNAHNWNCNGCRWGWARGVFWPFGYGDMFSFAWWPYAATAPFWGYGVDYVLNGVFWPYGAYAWPGGGYGATAYSQTTNNYQYSRESHEDIYSAGPANGSDDKQAAAVDSKSTELATCSGFAPGVDSLPIDKIDQAVKPTGDQRGALKDLEAASNKAEGILKAACPSEPPLTPVGRLDALQKRLNAMVQAVDIVQGPLTSFDDALSPEQKQALDAIGGSKGKDASASLCTAKDEQFADVPAKEIEATIQPNDQQRAALDHLNAVSAKASEMLKATCPTQVPSTTQGRLEAMNKRLKATVTAMNEVHPALVGFYDSLSDEQKARFNTMGPEQTTQKP